MYHYTYCKVFNVNCRPPLNLLICTFLSNKLHNSRLIWLFYSKIINEKPNFYFSLLSKRLEEFRDNFRWSRNLDFHKKSQVNSWDKNSTIVESKVDRFILIERFQDNKGQFEPYTKVIELEEWFTFERNVREISNDTSYIYM